jgi:pyruvate dehydrogenase E2 component (dihydrolipoamide acetyltransferase)
MATPIIMPKFGQMTEESTIVEWFKKEGDTVAKGDLLFAVETDKSVMEVESFEEGTLIKIAVKTGISVPVQSVVGFLGKPGEPIPEMAAPALQAATPSPAKPLPVSPARPQIGAPVPVAAATPVAASAPALFRISPRARALARDSVIDPSRLQGTGPDGRVVEKDVRAYLLKAGYDRLRITPAAKRLAAKEEIDLLSIKSEDGRIDLVEVERAVAEKPVPMSKMRQVIAQRLATSMATAPHWYCSVSADMGNVIAVRAVLKQTGVKVSINDFIAFASVAALKEFPAFNSTTDGKSLRWSSRVHLGVAVSLDEGLVVPVIRSADGMTLAEIGARSAELAAKARAGKLSPDEMSGSTFTISNLGMLEVENFAAIINLGEAGILAVSSIIEKPVVQNGQIVIRPMMKMTVSSDHRLIDGATAARFINAIKKRLEDLEAWKSLT